MPPVALLHLVVVVPPITIVVPPVAVVVPPLPLMCRLSPCCPSPIAVAVPPVAVIVPPVAVVVPRRHAAHHLLCSLAANQRSWTKPRHSGVAHDVYMEQVPLDMRNGGRWCEYNDINDHDFVMSEIPWFCTVVDGSTLPNGSFVYIKSYVKPFLIAKTHPTPTNTPQQPFVTSTMVENIEYDIGAQAN